MRIYGWFMAAALAACGHAEKTERAPARAEGPREVVSRPGGPRLSSSAAGLLRKDAAEQIQGRLIDEGFLERRNPTDELDAATRTALRKYQRSEDLPETGFPDRETVRRLGLDPDRIFDKRTARRDDAP